MNFARFLPPIAWTALVAWLSGEQWGAPGTQFVVPFMHWLAPWATPEQLRAAHWLMRKAAHVTEYGVLAGLWRWSFVRHGRRAWLLALGLTALTAALDEIHQATTLYRTGSIRDVALDTAGASVALLLIAAGWRTIDWAVTILLWLSAVGGAAMVALHLWMGLPAGWLWASVPAAWIALFFWSRRAGRRVRRPAAPPAEPSRRVAAEPAE